MVNMTVRNLPDAVHRALRHRAAHAGRSVEAEIQFILESATRSPNLAATLAQQCRSLRNDQAEAEAIGFGSAATKLIEGWR